MASLPLWITLTRRKPEHLTARGFDDGLCDGLDDGAEPLIELLQLAAAERRSLNRSLRKEQVAARGGHRVDG